MNQEEARAQCTSIWSGTGPDAVAGEDNSGFLLEELQVPAVCSIYTPAGESDSVIPAQEVACWCGSFGLWNKREGPPSKRSVRGAEEALVVDLLAELLKQMKFSFKSHSCCCCRRRHRCCWSLSGLLAPWQQLELKYCHMSINHRHTRWTGDEMFLKLPDVESFKWLMEMRFWIYVNGRLTFLHFLGL